MKNKIKNDEEFSHVMAKIETILGKATGLGGFEHLDVQHREELRRLSLLAEAWEDQIQLMPIRKPANLIEMIRLCMYERRLNQQDMANLLEISPTRLSEVLQGKRKVNMDLAKRLYQRLNIDPAFILESA
jgi:HTH-type transcriptional regulator/antitoxin HigA